MSFNFDIKINNKAAGFNKRTVHNNSVTTGKTQIGEALRYYSAPETRSGGVEVNNTSKAVTKIVYEEDGSETIEIVQPNESTEAHQTSENARETLPADNSNIGNSDAEINSSYHNISELQPIDPEALKNNSAGEVQNDTISAPSQATENAKSNKHTNPSIRRKPSNTEEVENKAENQRRSTLFSKTPFVAAAAQGAAQGVKKSTFFDKIYSATCATFSPNVGLDDAIGAVEGLADSGLGASPEIINFNLKFEGVSQNFIDRYKTEFLTPGKQKFNKRLVRKYTVKHGYAMDKALKFENFIDKYNKKISDKFHIEKLSNFSNAIFKRYNNFMTNLKHVKLLNSWGSNLGDKFFSQKRVKSTLASVVTNKGKSIKIIGKAEIKEPKGILKFLTSDRLRVGAKWLGRVAFAIQTAYGTYSTYKAVDDNGGIIKKDGVVNKKGVAAGIREGSKQTGGIAGAWVGGKLGAAIGAPFVPPFGAIVGGVVGGVAGYIAGTKVGENLGKAVCKYGKTALKTTAKITLAPVKTAVVITKGVCKIAGKAISGVKNGAKKLVSKITAKSKVAKTALKYTKKVFKFATAPARVAAKGVKTAAKGAVNIAKNAANKFANTGRFAKAMVNTAKSATTKIFGWITG